jgi:vancomycin permeability regulator SanA
MFFIRGSKVYLESALFSVAVLGAFFIYVFLYSLSYDKGINESFENENNLAFVLGAAVWKRDKPSPMFEGRIEKSYELYKNGMVSKIQVTGSNAPGELSEAKTAYFYLLKKGVDKTDILTEEHSSNTHQQIMFLKKNEQKYRKNFENFILISDEFHLVRLVELCRFYDLKVITVTSDYELNWEKLLYYRIRESVALFLFWLFGI